MGGYGQNRSRTGSLKSPNQPNDMLLLILAQHTLPLWVCVLYYATRSRRAPSEIQSV
jgi:hypothetical protein